MNAKGWELNAPAGYRWTDAAVREEKADSFLCGLIVGALAGVTLAAIAVAVFS